MAISVKCLESLNVTVSHLPLQEGEERGGREEGEEDEVADEADEEDEIEEGEEGRKLANAANAVFSEGDEEVAVGEGGENGGQMEAKGGEDSHRGANGRGGKESGDGENEGDELIGLGGDSRETTAGGIDGRTPEGGREESGHVNGCREVEGKENEVLICGQQDKADHLFGNKTKEGEELRGSGGENKVGPEEGGVGEVEGHGKQGRAKGAGHSIRETRTLCLRVIAIILTKFPDLDFAPQYWDIFFTALAPTISRLRQEASSSETPGALFSCLLAMSRSAELAPLLAFNEALLPNLLLVLASRTAAPAVVTAVLTLVENLLDLEKEYGDEGRKLVQQLVLPHLPLLLTQLQEQLVAKREQISLRKSGLSAQRELALLVRLSRHVQDRQVAAQLVEVLLPFLRLKRRTDEESSILEVLRVVVELSPRLPLPTAQACVRAFAPLLAALTSSTTRWALCQALQGLSAADPGLTHVAHLISELNSMSTDTLDEFDYTKRLDNYAKIDGEMFGQMSRSQASLLLSTAVHDMAQEDMSVRQSASHCVETFVRFAASLPEDEGVPPGASGVTAGEPMEVERWDEPGHEGDADVNGNAEANPGKKGSGTGGTGGTGAGVLETSGVMADDVAREQLVTLEDNLPEDLTQAEEKETNELEKGKAQRERTGPENGKEEASQGALPAKEESLRGLVQGLLLPHIRNSVGSGTLAVRREWVGLLREIAEKFAGSIGSMHEFQVLLSTDPEADFFYNIVHLQVHRRIRAMARFRSACQGAAGGEAAHVVPFSQGTLLRIFAPMFQQSLFEARGDKEGNLVDAALQSLAIIARHLAWEPYYGLLMRFWRLLQPSTKGGAPGFGPSPPPAVPQKTVLRVMCAILDEFHFFEAPSGTEGAADDAAAARNEHDEDDPMKADNADASIAPNGSEKPTIPPAIQKVLQKKVLLELTSFMVSEMDMVNAPVALAVVKILLLLPEPIIETELPRILQSMAIVLKSRGQGVRDTCRASLVQVSQALGPRYLHFILEVLQSTLQRGFEVHVLGYTLHAILYKMAPTLIPGDVDYCLAGLLEVLENDVMGAVADEKEVAAIAARMKETRHMRSYESLRLLAQVVDFECSAGVLLQSIRRNLVRSLSPKVKAKVEEMLRYLTIGVMANPTATSENVLVFVHAVVEDGLQDEVAHANSLKERKQARAEGRGGKPVEPKKRFLIEKAPATGASQSGEGWGGGSLLGGIGKVFGDKSEGETGEQEDGTRERGQKGPIPNGHLLITFAMELMHTYMRKGRIATQDPLMLSMLDPMVGLLYRCLDLKYDSVLASALKCLADLLRLPLPAVSRLAGDVAERAFVMVHRAGKATSEVAQACLRMMTVVIRHCEGVQVSEDRLRDLLQSGIFIDLEESSTRNTAFGLLRAIVGRRLLAPELYDLMTRVGEVLVHSQAPGVRQLCSQTLLVFLLDYPLGPRRLQQHIDFMITNLGYEHASGRMAVLEMLQAMMAKFPQSLLDEQAEALFLPLVARLVSDPSREVRVGVGKTLQTLVRRGGPRAQERMLKFALTWYSGPKQKLWRPAAQVLGFAVESLSGAGLERHVATWLPAMEAVLRASVEADEASVHAPNVAAEGAGVEEDAGDEGGGANPLAPLWQEAYFSLLTFEKMVRMRKEFVMQKRMEPIWDLICRLLLHRHTWVRRVCCRLVGTYLALTPEASQSTNALLTLAVENRQGNLLHPSRVLLLTASMCRLLEAEACDEKFAEQVVKNLVFVAPLLLLLPWKAIEATGGIEAIKGNGIKEGVPDMEERRREGGREVAKRREVEPWRVIGCEEGEALRRVEMAREILVGRRGGRWRGMGRRVGDEAEERGNRPGGEEEEEEEEEDGDGAEMGEEIEEREGEEAVGVRENGGVVGFMTNPNGRTHRSQGTTSVKAARISSLDESSGAVHIEGLHKNGVELCNDSKEEREERAVGGHKEGRILRSDGGERTEGRHDANGEHAGDAGEANEAVAGVFSILAKVALRVQQAVQACAALRACAALSTRLGPEGLLPYLPLLLMPLFRITEGSAGGVVPDELKALADEVTEHVRELVGVPRFVQVFNAVRARVKGRREGRKKATKIAVLVDPVRATKRKMKQAEKRQLQKKRKIAEFKRQRGDIDM
eukprot:TRINITY_DN1612_c2_g3_i1.p1 TRINITY_DN1612_c2_g3~~TRINITY_DN1612_c2_g3_i1.p1  ORF type:complete len:2175 (-),score=483.44 TRINITY_DN1612_c2_g3_i1:572-6958(-)